MNHPFRSPRPPAEAERLREVFAEAAYDVTPSAVPLAAIEREGRRRRRRRRATVLGAACGVLLVPLAVVVLRDGAAGGPAERVKPPAASAGTTSPSPSVPAGKVRVVTPGERVQVAPGIRVWLTEDGKHWLEPGVPEAQFRSVSDGNLDMSRPGISLQESGQDDSYFLSGIFHGRGEPARVEVETTAGKRNGTALTLAGKPGWGVWYLLTKLPDSATSASGMVGVTKRVTVYDSAGGVIASQDFAL